MELSTRETQAYELRLAGLSFRQIAKKLRYADPSGAYQAFSRAQRTLTVESAEEWRVLEIERLAFIQKVLWEKVQEGSLPAMNMALKVIDLRAKLLRLYAPDKGQSNQWDVTEADLDAEIQKIITTMNEREEEFMARREAEVRAEMRAQFEIEKHAAISSRDFGTHDNS